ncbi:MAG: lysophospholipid acyltransferase family protein [Smithellaceae bacterium]|nr:lysophospholipid acyltransferase family protein [Smithellaceae bacterium]
MIKRLVRATIRYGLIPVVYWIIRLYLWTVKVTIVGEDALFAHLDGGGKGIIGVWHQRIFGALSFMHRMGRYSPSAIVSQSRDGDLIARVFEICHIRPFRGSSSRGGRQAYQEILADLALHPLAAHALDGPQGPRWVVKPGLVAIARASQAPVIPVYISINRAWALRSWDRQLIPKPFSRIIIYWDRPIEVPEKLDEVEFEAARAALEGLMKNRQQALDDACRSGKKGVIFHDEGR